MSASRLRARVILQQPVHTPDGAGGVTRSWENVATLWAEIQPLRGQEVQEAGRLQGSTTHKVTIRYRSGVTAAQRFLYESTRVFNIRSVMNLAERDEFLELLVEEGVAT